MRRAANGVEMSAERVRDRQGRPLRSLRLSVTDRCNLRCAYCMPDEHYGWIPRDALLAVGELERVVDAFVAAGVNRVRLTGGEPLLRPELEALIAGLAARPLLKDVALTTNGVLLAERCSGLQRAGLHRVTVSLDTLWRERFQALTRRDEHGAVLAGIDAAAHARFPKGLKLDTVVIRGFNDDELSPLLEYAGARGAELRFIEYMDVGGASRWSRAQVVPQSELLGRLEAEYGRIRALPREGAAPARRFALPDGRIFGVVASVTQPFCGDCDRARIMADGTWLSCLYARRGVDLRTPLRLGASAEELARLVRLGWKLRADQGAVERAGLAGERGAWNAEPEDQLAQMHARGG